MRRFGWFGFFALVLSTLALGTDYSLRGTDGKLPELLYFNKNSTQKTIAHLLNLAFQSQIKDPALKSRFRVESLLRLGCEGLRILPAPNDITRLQVIMVGEFLEVRLKKTISAAPFLAGIPQGIDFGPYEKKYTGVGSGSGRGELTLRFNPFADTVTVEKFTSAIRLKSLFFNELDGASLGKTIGRRGTLPSRPLYFE